MHSDLFDHLCYALNVRPDRHAECHVECPSCGKPPKRGQVHFSFNRDVGFCFVCGEGISLRRLAEHYGLTDDRPLPVIPRIPAPPPKPAPSWTLEPDYWQRYQPLPRVALDYCYSRGLSDESIQRWRIGWGALPAPSSPPRLILPTFERGQLRSLRARAVRTEDKGPKWLTATGSTITLFGADELVPDRPVVITEAPLSAILAMQESNEISAVAIGSASSWREEWTELIARMQPPGILVWLDNDAAGLAGAVKIGNALAKARLPVQLYRWGKGTPEHKSLTNVVNDHQRGTG